MDPLSGVDLILRMRVGAIGFAATLVGCGAPSESPPPEPEAVEVAPATEPGSPPEPHGSRIVVDTDHVATFIHGVLDECVDIEFTSTVPPELPEWGPPETPVGASSDRPLGIFATRVARPCGEQFGGRTVLATCSVTSSGASRDAPGVTFSATFNSRYFRFATALENDNLMRRCMTRGGDWWALADDSVEYGRVEAAFFARELERATRGLGGRRR